MIRVLTKGAKVYRTAGTDASAALKRQPL